MANEIKIDYAVTGQSLYAIVLNSAGKIWNGTTFETIAAANWATYDIALTEQSTTGVYIADFPSAITDSGVYDFSIRFRVAATPATTDPVVGSGQVNWNGTTVITPGLGTNSFSNPWREYCTLEDFRAAKMPTETSLVYGTDDGTVILDFIREVSKIIDNEAGRRFAPYIATRYFDAEKDISQDGLTLRVSPFDLLAIGTITNGDATSVTADQYVFEPRHNPPYWAIRIKSSKGIVWTYNDDPENAITLALATWGYHDDYANAWESLTTLGAAITTVNATSITLAGAVGNPGDLLKIDSEFVYLSARASTTATIVRGVNGSTAATHLNAATVYRWKTMHDITGLCKAATSIKYAIRENPQVESITVDNHVISRPKDITAFIRDELNKNGLVKI